MELERQLKLKKATISANTAIEIATNMVYMAHAMGADCIKFQTHIAEKEMINTKLFRNI